MAWLESCRGRDQEGIRKPKALSSDLLNLNLFANGIKKKKAKKKGKSCAGLTVLQIAWVAKYFSQPNRGHGLDRTHYGFVEPQLLSSLSLKELLNNKKKAIY